MPFLAGCHYDTALPGHLKLCFEHCHLFAVLLLWQAVLHWGLCYGGHLGVSVLRGHL